ncbi:stAR-related lipid transfer protein 7, mitochondrial isoform X1 [Nasonia vitripennis]|uniref:Phosphatidylcholine transfer protein n=1 Tax=Nasonia vitripennis TaxID=7425 RepID=A0A7M7H5A9_NASVI|nr:stAR-related lipid transfer protein 7, mitochondrial isoform X1 [Nasonia vitripennis]
MYSRYVSGILLRRYNSNIACDAARSAHFFPQHCGKVHGRFKWCGRKMSMWLREQSIQVVKACARQFEFIAAQRIRRSVQIFHLYTRIWDEMALKEFMRSWRRRVARNTNNFLVGAVGVTVFNWEQERIADKEMYSYSQEIDGIYRLREATVICPECHLRLIVDIHQPGVKYCQCSKVKRASHKAQQDGIEWEPFIERKDMLVWRREEKDCRGLYSYKVYGSFDDVSAEDFLQVQIDIDYRKEWDATAKQLEIIDTDPEAKESSESCSDVIYWEMVWPRMFANRDYVYQRRWLYDKETGMVIIVSKGIDHPNAPNRPDTHRVQTYWSYMVIKPYKNFNEPGIEFGLTYFDDPGVNIPSAVTAWVAMSGFPDYLCRMRQAGKDYKRYKTSQKPESAIPESIVIINSQDDEDDKADASDEERSGTNSQDDVLTITKNEDLSSRDTSKPTSEESENSKDKEKDEDEEEENYSDTSQDQDNQGFLDYFFFTKLFA